MLALSLRNIQLHAHVHLSVALLTLHVSIFHLSIHVHYKHGEVMIPNFPTMNDELHYCYIHTRCMLHTFKTLVLPLLDLQQNQKWLAKFVDQ